MIGSVSKDPTMGYVEDDTQDKLSMEQIGEFVKLVNAYTLEVALKGGP